MKITASLVAFFLDIIHALNSPCASVLTCRMKITKISRNKTIFLRYSQSILNTSQVCYRWSQNINSSSLILTVTIQITQLISVTLSLCSSVMFILILVVSISFTYAACTHPALCAFAHVLSFTCFWTGEFLFLLLHTCAFFSLHLLFIQCK